MLHFFFLISKSSLNRWSGWS